MPWKNGGGTTYEIARAPAAGEFQWRLSLAHIERSGPFSNFAGYRRALTLVSGAGCVLNGVGATAARLDLPGMTVRFAGDADVSCELIGGECWDLNLMVRGPGEIVAAHDVRVARGGVHHVRAEENGSIFCIEGRAECVIDEQCFELARHDTFLFGAPASGSVRVQAAATSAAHVLVHAWRNRSDK
jgi:environmental stress-induced protein Ves